MQVVIKKPGKGDISDGHSERHALAYAINNAIAQGWEPKDSDGNILHGFDNYNFDDPDDLEKKDAPNPKELLKYTKALQGADALLATEKDFCDNTKTQRYADENLDCKTLFETLFTSDKHVVYYSIPYGGNEAMECEKAKRYYSENGNSINFETTDSNPDKKRTNTLEEDRSNQSKRSKMEKEKSVAEINPILLKKLTTNQEELTKNAFSPVTEMSVSSKPLPKNSSTPFITGMFSYQGSRSSGLRRPNKLSETKKPEQTIANSNTNSGKVEEQTDSLEYEGMTEKEARDRCENLSETVSDIQQQNDKKFTMKASSTGSKTNWKIEFKYSTPASKTIAEDLIKQFEEVDKKKKKGFF